MKKRMCTFLAAAAAAGVLAAGMGTAHAYFTTYVAVRGGFPIEMGDRTEITETFSNWVKHVRIANEAGSEPVYIRAKAFCGSAYDLVYVDESGRWSPGEDGYYYYDGIVNGGEVTEELQVRIENVPEDITDPTSFNVVVVYESTPVRYDEAGNPYADWSMTLDSGSMDESGVVIDG